MDHTDNTEHDFIKESWDLIKDTLRKEYDFSDISYTTWIEPLKYGYTADDTVTIMIPSDQSHALSYISAKYKSYLQVTISEMFDHTYEIAFILEKDCKPPTKMMEMSNTTYNIQSENAHLNAKYKFNTFVVGSNNKFAHSAALAVAESPGESFNPLFIYGGPGLGKTHLMHSIGHFILENDSSMKVLYVTSEEFTNDVIESIRSGNAANLNALRDKYRTVDVLLIDDVQFIIGKQSTQEEFFNTFNTLHSAGKQIILSSDKPPKEMGILDERFRSRFEWGLIADIQPPDYETRMAILQKNAESLGKHIDDDVLNYIASNITSNIRELEGALNKINAYSRLNKVEININIAEEALKDIIYPDKLVDITPSRIINTVAASFDVTPDDILSKKRNSEFVVPRQVVMYLCRELTDSSLTSIGKLLGKKDHTTVLHGVGKIENQIEINSELKDKVDDIIKKLQNP